MERQGISSLLLHLLVLLLLLASVGFTDQTEQSEFEVSLRRSKRAAENATETTPCDPNPCQNKRKCNVVGSSYKCECSTVIETTSTEDVKKNITTGWTGVNCTEDIDECKANACFHTNDGNVCVNKKGSFKCLCDGEKYIGSYCEKKIDHCQQPHPDYGYTSDDRDAKKPLCLNRGNCSIINVKPFFKCTCVPGYDQVRCQRDIDECAPKPCQNNATCTDLVNDYNCTCLPGFTGRNCETNIDECKLHKPCDHETPCIDKINDYECNCTDTGYKGKNCSVEINECEPKPCKNGANCTDKLKQFICSCHPGYKGLDCGVDIDECSPNPCKFNSTCLQKSDSKLYGKKNIPPFNGNFSYEKAEGFVCECVNGTRGENCSENIDECKPNPCKNNATCKDKLADYECQCEAGYTGRNCETNIDECNLHKPCKNNGTCKDLVNDYECQCAPMNKDGLVYAGKNCSVELVACRNNECKNFATCKAHLTPVDGRNYSCMCKPGWTNWDCNVSTVLSYNGSASLTISGLSVTSVEIDVRVGADTTGITMAVATLNGKLALGVRDNHVVLNDGSAIGKQIVTEAGWLKMKVAKGELSVGKNGIVAKESVTKWLEQKAITKVEIGKEGTYGTIKMQPLRGCTRDIHKGATVFVATANDLKEGAKEGCIVPANPCKASTCAGARSRCLNLWNEFRCECELGRYGSTCEKKTVIQTFGNSGTSYVVFAAPPALKQRLADQGKFQFETQLITRASNKKGQEQLLLYYGISKKAATSGKATKYVMGTINDKGLLQVFITGLENPLVFPRPDLGDGFLHSLSLTLFKEAAVLVVNGTKYSPEGPQNSIPELRTELASADLLCIGGYKGLAAAATGPNFGVRVRRATDEKQQVPAAGVKASVGLKAAIGDARMGGVKLALSADDKTPGAVTSLANAGVKKGIVSDDLCIKGVCKNSRSCNNVKFNTFRCDCLAGWREQDCAFKDFCTTGTDQCPTGFKCHNVYRQNFYECAGALTFPGSTEPITFAPKGTAHKNLETLAVELRTRTATDAKLIEGKTAAGKLEVSLSMTAKGTVKATSPDGNTESSFKVNTGDFVKVVAVFEGGKAPVLQKTTKDAVFTATKDGNTAGVPDIAKIVLLPQKAFKGCISSVRANGYPFRLHTVNTKPNEGGSPKWSPEGTITLSTPPGQCKSAAVCTPNPCKNGRKCKDLWNHYECDCGTEYSGTHCENPKCQGTGGSLKHSACKNGGSCVTGATVFTCQCADGWGGSRCSIKDECKSQPCQNSGRCKMNFTTGEFLCTCPSEYRGKRCEEPITKTGSVNYALIFGLIGALLLILLILLIFLIVRHVRASRATSGNYNPHTREMNGSNVYMSNVMKPPPGERLI